MTDMSYAKLCKEFRPSKDYYYNRKELLHFIAQMNICIISNY